MNMRVITMALVISCSSLAAVDMPVAAPTPINTALPNYPIVESPKQSPQPATHKKDYFKGLFDHLEVAKETPPSVETVQLSNKLAKDSIAYGVLKEYPKLNVGPLAFRPLRQNSPYTNEIVNGQRLLVREFGSKTQTYKQFTDQIDNKLVDPRSPLTDGDWILMANALRTLKAPGSSHKSNLMGALLAEYVLLGEIKKIETKPNITAAEKSILSDLYYDLAQLYQTMYKNDEKLFNKPQDGFMPLLIEPIYLEDSPYGYDPLIYPVPFDYMIASRLDLLENSLLFDPYDDLAWAQLIDFAAYDLVDPWFYDQLYPEFWDNYFPSGLSPVYASRLRSKWNEIRHRREVRTDNSIRANRRGGQTTVNRLVRVHALPTSRLNQTVARSERISVTPARSSRMKEVVRNQQTHSPHQRIEKMEKILGPQSKRMMTAPQNPPITHVAPRPVPQAAPSSHVEPVHPREHRERVPNRPVLKQTPRLHVEPAHPREHQDTVLNGPAPQQTPKSHVDPTHPREHRDSVPNRPVPHERSIDAPLSHKDGGHGRSSAPATSTPHDNRGEPSHGGGGDGKHKKQ
jgi:hypothetical protein